VGVGTQPEGIPSKRFAPALSETTFSMSFLHDEAVLVGLNVKISNGFRTQLR
jgi:hypothetical protein